MSVPTLQSTRPATSHTSPVASDRPLRAGPVLAVVSQGPFRCPCHPGVHQLVAVRCPYCRDVHAARWTFGATTTTKRCFRSGWTPFVVVADPRRFPVLTLAAIA